MLGRLFSAAFILGFLGLGAAIAITGLRSLNEAIESEAWPQIDGVIKVSEIVKTGNRRTPLLTQIRS